MTARNEKLQHKIQKESKSIITATSFIENHSNSHSKHDVESSKFIGLSRW